MTIVRVEKLATGQYDVVLRMTDKEAMDLAGMIMTEAQRDLPPVEEPPPGDEESEQRIA